MTSSSRRGPWPRVTASVPNCYTRWPEPASKPTTTPGRFRISSYLKDYPKGADRLEARYHLGEAQPARPVSRSTPG